MLGECGEHTGWFLGLKKQQQSAGCFLAGQVLHFLALRATLSTCELGAVRTTRPLELNSCRNRAGSNQTQVKPSVGGPKERSDDASSRIREYSVPPTEAVTEALGGGLCSTTSALRRVCPHGQTGHA